MITFKGKSDHNPRSMRGGSGNRKEEAEESQRSRKTPKRRGTGKPLRKRKDTTGWKIRRKRSRFALYRFEGSEKKPQPHLENCTGKRNLAIS